MYLLARSLRTRWGLAAFTVGKGSVFKLLAVLLAAAPWYNGVGDRVPSRPPLECVDDAALGSTEVQRNDYRSMESLVQLREQNRNRWIHLAGDETVFAAYEQLVLLFKREQMTLSGGSPRGDVFRIGSSRLSFVFAPRLGDVQRDWEDKVTVTFFYDFR
jgi:hypothetical protein